MENKQITVTSPLLPDLGDFNELLKDICSKGSAILMITHNLNLLTEYPGKVYQFENHHIKEVTEQFGNFISQNAE